jgi:hypothetical protein
MFFDDHPRFLETSTTANNAGRLNMRHTAMFESNQRIFPGARVLDIASHDGRWTMAALKLGAAHVTGIEVMPDMVKHAEETFAHYDVDPSTYRFINDDVFDVLGDAAAHQIEVDVVMCLGFIYHTLRYQELLSGVRALRPKHFLIDTAVILEKRPLIKLNLEDVSKQSAGDDHTFTHEGHLVTGRPSVSALELLLAANGFDIVDRFDWPAFLSTRPNARVVASYAAGKRVTWLCSPAA